MITIGIDPGLDGAIAVVSGEFTMIYDMPVTETPIKRTRTNKKTKEKKMVMGVSRSVCAYELGLVLGGLNLECSNIFLEKVRSMPRDGAIQAFAFGDNNGMVKGVIGGLGYKPNLVTPQKWKKHFGLIAPPGSTDTQKKKLALNYARSLDLDVDLRLEKHTGRADALLIALYGQAAMGS